MLTAHSHYPDVHGDETEGSLHMQSLAQAFRDAVQDMSSQGAAAGLDSETIAVMMAEEADRLVAMEE